MTVSREITDLFSNTATTALIKAGDTFYGSVGVAGDRDWVAVDLVAGRSYSFAAVGIGPTALGDVYLRIMGPNGRTTGAVNDDGLPNLHAILPFGPTTTGRYYIEISGQRSTQGDYGLTMAEGDRPDFEVPMIAGVIVDQQNTWSTTTLTYGFRQSGDDAYAAFNSRFSVAQQSNIALIMAYYAEVVNLSFTNQGETNDAQLLFANYGAYDSIGAFAYGPGDSSVNGDVWYNENYNDGNFAVGSDFYEIMLHEIGHTMGLSHPGLYDAGNGGSISYANSAQFTQDSESWTIMSYFGSDETGGSDLIAQTLGIADILALQNAYGANMSTRAGDDSYGLGGAGIYDFDRNTKLTIWDGGGTDTLDLSASSANQFINLNEGTLSDIFGRLGNLGIAVGTILENARGGSGADTIIGNAFDNDLYGGGGVDQLFGGAGADHLRGDADADILVGGAGDDIFYVDNARDVIIEGVGGGYDIVQAAVSYTLAAGIAIQELRAEGAVNLTGNGSSNRLVAGTGVNNLTGGGGRDVFVFDFGSSTSSARDTITDFTQGLDRVDLGGIDANSGLAGDQAFLGLGNSAGVNRLWWLASGSDLILRGDIDGNATADFELLLRNLANLTTADIIL